MLSAKKELFTPSGGGYQISRSVRMRSNGSTYFNRTPASASNRQIWTWSGWIKRGDTSNLSGSGAASELTIFGSGTNTNAGNGVCTLGFTGNDYLQLWQFIAGTQWNLVTTQVFRDYSAWYHIVFAVDTTQATASNRIKLYVNGVQVTAFGTASYPSQNYNTGINSTDAHNIGRRPDGQNYWGGYLTENNFIDGQALTPSSFGETNPITGVWQPKRYSGTYGTNGFYLNFSDNSASTAATIGKDYSGNGNNWTPSAGISVTAGTTYDSMLDVPTPYADGGNGRGNYAVMNPLSVVSPTTIANGNLDVTTGTTGGGGAFSTIAIPTSGKYYFEFLPTSATTVADNIRVGVSNSTVGSYVLYKSDGNKVVDGSTTSYGATFTTNDTIGCAVDVDGGTITFYKNNSSQGSITYATSSGNFFAYTQDGSGTVSVVASFNFGQRPFTYTPPTGFKALNTQNLPDATIKNGASYMAATTYTGTGSNRSVSNAVNGVSFQPDLVWIKCRSTGYNHNINDSVRGANNTIYSNATSAEIVNNPAGYTSAFNSDGFNVATGPSDANQVNASAQTYVAWQWNAGGSTVTNTSGSISAQVRANTTAGFSVVTFTAPGGSAQTIGHGLGVAPRMIIIKSRNNVSGWNTYHASVGNTGALNLQTTGATSTSVDWWNNTSPTSTVWTIGANINISTWTFVAYCFAPVAGYSAFGSYTGNGSADGPFVFTGFRPRFVMVKCSSAASTNWVIRDTVRDPINPEAQDLYANLANAEATSPYPFDGLSNGFKIRNTVGDFNTNGATYIFMAFAEVPFRYANAR